MIYFITGNKNKFEEVRAVLPVPVEQLTIDLPEIQELDPHAIIAAKLEEAFAHHEGPFMVEDTSLCMDALNGLPGPFIKWFEKTVTIEGLASLASRMGTTGATARVCIGYAKSRDSIEFFEGTLSGTIVAPRGTNGFGWDVIFQPEGHNRTMAEMTMEEKNELSMRAAAARALAATLK